jgi:hypothetical protein
MLREFGGAGAEHVAVEEEQGLRGHDGLGAFAGDLSGLGEVEYVSQLRRAGLGGGADDGRDQRSPRALDCSRRSTTTASD